MSWTQDVDLKHSSVANDLVSDLGAVCWSFGCLVVTQWFGQVGCSGVGCLFDLQPVGVWWEEEDSLLTEIYANQLCTVVVSTSGQG